MVQNSLRLDWATHQATAYACKNWHYSKCLPVGKLVKVGAWESGRFVGVVVFGRGATPNLCKPYGLSQVQCVELVRVALRDHAAPVSRIVALSLKFLKQHSSGVKLVVSFADRSQGHHGGIYQAGNWIYSGTGNDATFYMIRGKLTHPRSIGAAGKTQNITGARQIDPKAYSVEIPGKHRYLMPLAKDMKSKIQHLAKPYPKRVRSVDSDTPAVQVGEGGATPTRTLQKQKASRE